MSFGDNDDESMLIWEKVNALEHVRKSKIAEQETLDNRVIDIGDRCVCLMLPAVDPPRYCYFCGE